MPHLAFLAHNSVDKATVKAIATGLRVRNVKYWFDDERIDPSDIIPRKIEEGLRASTTFVAFLGPGAVGDWQQMEIYTAIYDAISRGLTIIPALFGGMKPENLPPFLKIRRAIEFESGTDAQAIDALSEAIKKTDPGTPPPAPPDSQPLTFNSAINLSEDNYKLFLDTFLDFARKVDINFLVGPAARSPDVEWTELSRKLIVEEAGLRNADKWFASEALAPSVELAAMIYTLCSQEGLASSVLHGHLGNQDTKHTQMTAERLASLLLRLQEVRSSQNLQVVLTTNHDLALERAMLIAGLSFTRIIQDVSRRRLIVEEYSADNQRRYVKGRHKLKSGLSLVMNSFADATQLLKEPLGRELWHSVAPNDGMSQGLIGRLDFIDRKKPILYKFKGSVDIEGSCIVSTDHFFDAASSRAEALMPRQISNSLTTSVPLFLGFYLSDMDLRLLLKTVLAQLPGGLGMTKFALSPKPPPEHSDIPGGQEKLRVSLGSKLHDKLNSDGYKTIYRSIPDFLTDARNRL